MSDAAHDALSDPTYRAAFAKAMVGEDNLWTEEERESVRQAKEATGHKGPGYPAPTADPNVEE